MSARNWTAYHEACSKTGLLAPPTNVTLSANLAFPNMQYVAAAVQTCCGGKTGTYGPSDNGTANDCMIYCEIAGDLKAGEKNLTKCINATAEAKDDPEGGFSYSMSPARNPDGSVSGAAGLMDATRGGMMGYMVLVLGVSSAVFGLL